MKSLFILLFMALFAWPRVAMAGPPFQLDDPDVIPYQHFEFYTFASMGSTPGETDLAGPAVEFNWSGVPNVMFHFIVPAGAAFPSDAPATFGLTDSEAGLQYRFVQESKYRPMIGTFTMMEIPTGDPARGLGAGKPSWRIPIWMQKSIGQWTLDWGGGEEISHIQGARNFPFGGALLQHDVTKRLSMGGEMYYHGRETAGTLSSRYAAMVDIGGSYTLHDPGFQLLFAYGHTVAGQTENYAYLGLYWTWGPKSSSHN